MGAVQREPVRAADVAGNILALLAAHQRVLPGAETPAPSGFHPDHLARLMACITARSTIHFILPAFPAKSANPLKTLGDRPDLGELLSLQFLDNLCRRIARHHPPGARLTICSDGRVFNDLVGVRDEAVTRYRADMRALIEKHRFGHIDLIDLDDLYPARDYDAVRGRLIATHGQPLESLRRELLGDPAGMALLNGIHRFLLDDKTAACPELSRSRARNLTRDLAYQTIQRSNAWSQAVAERFPGAIRLSIHPQPPRSAKLGILLLPAADVWRTPWHAAVIDTGTEFRLVRRIDAENSHARLQLLDGRPGYFVAANARPQELPQ
jgi:pyoverdine/dityrosine biosynthesis protein Dit1